MDCNRDEAVRSKEIAERRFLQKDYVGAQKFALKAQRLFPQLHGLEPLIAILDVHVHAHAQVADWYAILQLDPSADDTLIRKQYRKLALMLHPDKNKSVGADSAFKLISEAWSVLSDNKKKMDYDKKRSSMGISKLPRPPSAPPPPSTGKFTTKNHENAPRDKHKSHMNARPNTPSATFWTACPQCKLQFEYLSTYKNKNLCCPICYKPFIARMIVVVDGTTVWPLQEQKGAHSINGYAKVNPSSKCSVFGFGELNSSPHVKFGGRKENIEVLGPSSISRKDEMKRAKDELKSKVRGHAKEAITRFMAMSRGVIEQGLSAGKVISKGTGAKSYTTHGEKKSARIMDDTNAANNVPDYADSSPGEVEVSEITNSAEKRNHHHVQPILNQCFGSSTCCEMQQNAPSPAKKSRITDKGLRNEEILKEMGDEQLLTNAPLKVNNVDVYITCQASMPKSDDVRDSQKCKARPKSPPKASNRLHIQDSEFYVFNKDRTEHHFSTGQIWACYDDDAGCFPRYYAHIQNVVSCEPFKINYALLEADSRLSGNDTSLGLKAGCSYTCGEFKLGDVMTSLSINMFSHVMSFEKGTNGTFKIYPGKGEVWALYKEHKYLKGMDENHGYDLVEVGTDYSDERGVQVATLASVEGYKAIFQRQFGLVHWILPEDMRVLFSHRIPAHQLVAGEVPILLEGCWELDPASIPTK